MKFSTFLNRKRIPLGHISSRNLAKKPFPMSSDESKVSIPQQLCL